MKSNSRKTENNAQSPVMFEPLEPRVLLSAALPVAPMDNPVAEVQNLCAIDIDVNFETNALLNAPLSDFASDRVNSEIRLEENNLSPEQSAEIAEQTAASELIIVDTSVTDFQRFLDEIILENNDNRIFEVVTIDTHRNGIDQISDILSGYENLDAVHIISHGSDGRIILGDVSLDSANLESYADQITAWGNSLSADSDMLFYGCSIAGSSQGRALLISLADLTGADVAASTDLTGAVSSGGDWDLEFVHGTVEAGSLFEGSEISDWQSVLAGPPTITSDGGGATASVDAAENQTAVTTVTATGGVTPYTFSIIGGADQAFFSIDSGTGVLAFDAAPDREAPADSDTNNVYEVQVQVMDSDLKSDTQTISVTVTNVNDNDPVITSDGGGATAGVNAAENQTAVTTVTATDADGTSPSSSITGGTDAALFSIDTNTGVLTFDAAPDYESPADANTDNDYVVEVTATDGTNTDVQTITVTVTDESDLPAISSDGGGATAGVNAAENQTAVTTVTASSGTTPYTFSIIGGADQALFSIDTNTGVLTFDAAPDYESPTDSDTDNDYIVQVRVTDDNSDTDDQTITVTVTNENDNTPTITSDGGGATAGVNAAEN
ncbi:MAG: DUF4347 domain-containing protein, partial [Planctomycetota bacterium]